MQIWRSWAAALVLSCVGMQAQAGRNETWERLGGQDYMARCKEWATGTPAGRKT